MRFKVFQSLCSSSNKLTYSNFCWCWGGGGMAEYTTDFYLTKNLLPYIVKLFLQNCMSNILGLLPKKILHLYLFCTNIQFTWYVFIYFGEGYLFTKNLPLSTHLKKVLGLFCFKIVLIEKSGIVPFVFLKWLFIGCFRLG